MTQHRQTHTQTHTHTHTHTHIYIYIYNFYYYFYNSGGVKKTDNALWLRKNMIRTDM